MLKNQYVKKIAAEIQVFSDAEQKESLYLLKITWLGVFSFLYNKLTYSPRA